MILYNHISKGNTSVTVALALAVNFSNLFGDQVIIPYSEEKADGVVVLLFPILFKNITQ